MTPVVQILRALTLIMGLPLLFWVTFEVAWRRRWVRDIFHRGETLVAGRGVFRESSVRLPDTRDTTWGIPWALRLTAVSCFFLAQMVIPGTFAALLGLLLAVIAPSPSNTALILIILGWAPGAIAASRTFLAGMALLRGRRSYADQRVRAMVRFVVGYNLLAMTVLVGGSLLPIEHLRKMAPFALGYCVLSLLHALLVHRVYHRNRSRFMGEDALAVEASTGVVIAPSTAAEDQHEPSEPLGSSAPRKTSGRA